MGAKINQVAKKMGKCILKFMLKPAEIDGKGVNGAYCITKSRSKVLQFDDLCVVNFFWSG